MRRECRIDGAVDPAGRQYAEQPDKGFRRVRRLYRNHAGIGSQVCGKLVRQLVESAITHDASMVDERRMVRVAKSSLPERVKKVGSDLTGAEIV
ncbi:hypothetical protein KCMC57_up05750 [Kitasatospora sp. CMC57]|uniref:Transposase n=1 Tax=Kitasatospora sp. CMC57 TaxID=3231513 RepID=A0AB33JS22_9ACTN